MYVFDWMDAFTAPDRVIRRRYAKAREELAQGHYMEALSLLESAIRMNPTDPYLYSDRGIVYHHLSNFDSAIADFSTVIRLGGTDPGIAHYNRALIYARQGNIEAAIRDYAEALSNGLDIEYAIHALEQRGYLLIQRDDLQRAESNFLKLLDVDVNAADRAYFGLAAIRFELKDYDGAIENYSKILDIAPDNEIALYRRGFMCIKKRDWEQALTDYDRAVQVNPTVAHSYNNRGFVRIHLGDLQGAQKDFEQALTIDEQHPYAVAGLGDLHFLSGQYALALEQFKKSADLNPDINGVQGSLAVTYHALGQFEQATEIWRQLIDKDANYLDIDWVRDEHTWPEPLVVEARKLIAAL